MRESKIPFPTMFITSSLLTPNFSDKGVPDHLVTGKMFTPVNKLFIGAFPIPGPPLHGHSAHEDVQKEKMANCNQVIQRRMFHKLKEEMAVFFSSFTINTFNSLAERQAKFKIVRI